MSQDIERGHPPVVVSRDAPWTAEDLQDLPEGWRYEIVDGILLVSPRPGLPHARLLMRVMRRIEDALPEGLEAVHEPDVKLPSSTRSPDGVVFRSEAVEGDELYLRPEHLVLAVEVESPNSRATDTFHKPAEYADAGIPYYWLVQPGEPPTITAYVLDERATTYRIVSGPAPQADVPFAVDLS